jgi:hypothetical protein
VSVCLCVSLCLAHSNICKSANGLQTGIGPLLMPGSTHLIVSRVVEAQLQVDAVCEPREECPNVCQASIALLWEAEWDPAVVDCISLHTHQSQNPTGNPRC